MPMKNHPGFHVTFDTVTPESAEVGESHRSGWWDTGGHLIEDPMAKPYEPAFLFDQDDYEHDDLDEAIVEWACAVLRDNGAYHPNCYPPQHATSWGTEGNEVIDYNTGETIRKSFHFHGFTEEQIKAINWSMSQ